MKTALTALTLLWCGLVLGLSFIETPLKFQAPEITRELGLGIGQLVFTTLNRIEWFFAVATVILLVRLRPAKLIAILLVIPLLVVLLQTFWLLPVLHERIDLIRSGTEPAPSAVHWIYIGVEIAKWVGLLIGGILLAHQANPTGKLEAPPTSD